MTAPSELDPHDLRRLLMAASTPGASGEYEHADWSVSFEPNTDSALQYLVSVHESMHAALNDSTAFGTLLHVYSHLFRNGVDSTRSGAILDELIGSCLESHEAFATWTSVVMVNRGSEDRAAPSRRCGGWRA